MYNIFELGSAKKWLHCDAPSIKKGANLMQYDKPEIELTGPAALIVRNRASTKWISLFLDMADLPVQNYINAMLPPAYEADE